MATGPRKRPHRSLLIPQSHKLLLDGIEKFVEPDKKIVAICVLFSGGNDSTILTHLFKDIATHAIHVTTGIGIPETDQFVRDVCARWNLPLIEKSPPPGDTYRELVIDRGFPGPAHHWKMYQRLKERALRLARNELISHPRKERVIFLAGRRRYESARRANVPEFEREGSIVWISPLANWADSDMAWYRARHPEIPRNEVSDMIHMSGECLCGAFAGKGELDEIGFFFPEFAKKISELEGDVRSAGHPEERCQWGWGAYRTSKGRSKSGPMCSSCDARMGV